MSEPARHRVPLRERKQQRARQAIVEAALALFAERGFDAVTVSDIAERAEVGRSTFFRYFGDKQEVLFADDHRAQLAEQLAVQAATGPAIGDSLPAALFYVRSLVLSTVEIITSEPDGYELHERLVAQHPELRARSLSKHRAYARTLVDLLVSHGAERATATLAAEFGLACYYAGHAADGDDPRRLRGAVDAAFARLGSLRP
ncbi:TetR family transcriptional regulator [Catellatospora sp. NPDC049609]|uniref:TetR/AcrR family transcriptional regulator n=1 Tax=Catellatospora sp. NPDC049609 TaxID=3155505 RepID=UPI00343306B9